MDREKVVKGLTSLCNRLLEAAKQDTIAMLDASMVADAIALLKEQEPKPVELHTNAYGTKFYFCPKCKRELFHTRNLNFCEKCGQVVKWND